MASSQTLAHPPSGMVRESCRRLIDSRELCNLISIQNEKDVGVCFYSNRGGGISLGFGDCRPQGAFGTKIIPNVKNLLDQLQGLQLMTLALFAISIRVIVKSASESTSGQ